MSRASAAVSPEVVCTPRTTLDHDQRAVAYLIDAAAAIEERDLRERASRFIVELVATSPRFRGAVELFERLAEAVREIDGGMPDPAEECTGGEWAVPICYICDHGKGASCSC